MKSAATIVLCSILFRAFSQEACADTRAYYFVELKKEASLINRLETADSVLLFMSANYGKARSLDVRNYLRHLGMDINKPLPKLRVDRDRIYIAGITGSVRVVLQGGRDFQFVLPNGAGFVYDYQRPPRENLKRIVDLWQQPERKISSLQRLYDLVIPDLKADTGATRDGISGGSVLVLFFASYLGEKAASDPSASAQLLAAVIANATKQGFHGMPSSQENKALELIPQAMKCEGSNISLTMRDGTTYTLNFDDNTPPRPANLTISNASGNIGEILLGSIGNSWKVSGQQKAGQAANDQVPPNSADIVAALKDLAARCKLPNSQQRIDEALTAINRNMDSTGTPADASPPSSGGGGRMQ